MDLENAILNDSRKIFKPLKSREFFKNFTLDNWTIVWSNDFGFAPEFLHKLALKQNKKLEREII